MKCKYFGVCGSCKLYDMNYEEQLAYKKEKQREMFASLGIKDFDVISSDESHYRSRAEFRIWHDGDKVSYAMHNVDNRGKVCINECPKVEKNIATLMPKLLCELEKSELLSKRLFTVEFLAARDEMLVTLIYHKKIDESWDEEAKKVAQSLHVKIIGRSRKVKRVLSEDFVLETLKVNDKTYTYKMNEGAFSQPNRAVNEQMIAWVENKLDKSTCKDLLELYCGHGNFTLPLSQNFNKVMATEISKSSIKAATYNCEVNSIGNITFLRMSAEELTSALNKEREFNRLRDIDLDSYEFSHLFVDPPRAGLDDKSRDFAKKYDNIIYISCNPETLKRDLEELTKTHEIKAFALFDQFPYTEHVESGVLLEKR